MRAASRGDRGGPRRRGGSLSAGRRFRSSLRAGIGDTAPDGRVRLDAVARWVQDVAYGDLLDAGLADWAGWTVRRARLRVERFPRFAEAVEAETWCSGLGKLCAERRTTLRGAAGALVEAVALWVPLDRATGRPLPPGEAFAAVYGESAGGHRVRARLRHPAPPAGAGAAEGRPWTFRAADLDMAGHVNNAVYWQVLEEELILASRPAPEPLEVEIEHRAPASAGPARIAGAGDMRWVLGGADAATVVASLRR